MSSNVVPEAASLQLEAVSARSPRTGLVRWSLALLDSLLSKELRQGSPPELARCRVLAGSGVFSLLFTLSALFLFPLSRFTIAACLLCAGYATALVLLRRATSHTLPALVLCTTMALGSALVLFSTEGVPYIGTHATHMLVPAFAVYLLGARRGLFITLIICIGSGVIYPLYYVHFRLGPHENLTPLFWPLYVVAIITFIAAWALDSLHNAARDGAQSSLEETLSVMRESEHKLTSLIESTDDLVVSLDAEGRLLALNSAMKQSKFGGLGQEPTVGQPFFPESMPRLRAHWMPRLAQAMTGQRLRYEESFSAGGGPPATYDIRINPIHGTGGRITGVTIFARNISERKQAEARLGEMYRTLVDVSRQAGMAEIATGVLHNVGNTLNSVNISTSLVIDLLRTTRLPGLGKATALLQEHSDELGSFLTQDPQGQMVPAYLSALFTQLQDERDTLLREMRSLSDSVEHIKSIVSMQQKHARTVGAEEEVSLPQLIEEVLRLHTSSLDRLGIRIERDYADVPPLFIDRHKLLQILINLLNNARDALGNSETQDKWLRISVQTAPETGRVRIQVSDNGTGIHAEHLPRMFSQGFTTKKQGHGFGLHISALAAQELKGRLACASPGPGQGATFTLELPAARAAAA